MRKILELLTGLFGQVADLRELLLRVPPRPLGVTVKDAARLTAIGETALRRRIDAGEILIVTEGRRIIVPVSELERLLEREKATAEEHRGRADRPAGETRAA